MGCCGAASEPNAVPLGAVVGFPSKAKFSRCGAICGMRSYPSSAAAVRKRLRLAALRTQMVERITLARNGEQ